MTKRVTPCVPQAPPVGRGFVVWMVVLCVSAVPSAGAAAAAGKTEPSDGCRDGTTVPEAVPAPEALEALGARIGRVDMLSISHLGTIDPG